MSALELIESFVSGKISVLDFESELARNLELENYLAQQPPPRYANNHINTYYFLIESDLSNPFTLSGIKTHFKNILSANGIECISDNSEESEIEIISKVGLNWVDVPHSFIISLIRENKHLSNSELINFIKEKIKAEYSFLKKKPNWIQSPDWQYNNGKPMMFVTQIDLCDIFHDISILYVFIDKNDKTVKHLIQQM